jgi:protease-4
MGGLYEKLGVSVYRRSRGPLGDMFNSVEKFDDEQRAVVLASMQRVYEQFKQRVRKGRGAKIPDVEAVAAGRIFTGQQAVASGLADEIGGVNDALSALAVQLELAPGSYDIVTLPPAIGLGEFIEQFFNASTRVAAPGLALAGQSPILQTARAVLGERAWAQISRAAVGILQLQSEPVLTLMPSVLIVK